MTRGRTMRMCTYYMYRIQRVKGNVVDVDEWISGMG